MTGEEASAMSVQELENAIPMQATEGAAPVETAQATDQPKPQAQGEAVGQEQPKEDAPPAWFLKSQADLKRELGSLRSLASFKDQFPKLFEEQFKKQMAATQQAQRNANLSPEDQEAQAQLQSQQELLQKFVDERADARTKAQLEALAGEYGPILNELKESRAQEQLQNSAFALVKDLMPDEAATKGAWDKVFEKCANDIEKSERGSYEQQQAIARFDQLSTNPSDLALAMIQVQRSQVSTQAAQVTQQRSNAARQAAQSVKTGGIPSSGKKAVTEMDKTELASMSIADLEAAIPEQ